MIEVSRYPRSDGCADALVGCWGAAWTGNIAVFALYTLSGYLITRVLNEQYGFSTRGTAAFLLKRVVRLWPAYLAILGLRHHLFLGHMPVAAVLVTGLGLKPYSAFVFLATMVVALALSTGVVPMERTINVVRLRISRSVSPRCAGKTSVRRRDACLP